MFTFYYLAVVVFWFSVTHQVNAGNIIGGHKAAEHSRPYMVTVEMHKEFGSEYCDGFLVSKEFVITAAHCKAKTYKVCMGMNSYWDKHKICLNVSKDFPHEKYNNKTLTNDIMLLKLSSKVNFTEMVKPIPLANISDTSKPQTCLVSGWGKTNNNNKHLSLKLMEVNVTLIHNDLCAEENVFCSEGDKGPGKGDSGGPLVCAEGIAYGVISATNNHLKLTKYTKISENREWIDKIIKYY